MLSAFIQFSLSAATIVVAGIFLVKYADEISEITNIGRLFIGSILLAAATSLPEFMVDLSAVRNNMPNIAVGDLFGSSIFNLLILAIADLLHKGSSPIFSRASAKHALLGGISIGITSLVGIAILLERKLNLPTLLGIGLGPVCITIAYALGSRMLFYNQRQTDSKSLPTDPGGRAKSSLARALTGYIVAAVAILVAAPYLAEASGEIAVISGLGKTFIGTTLLAFSTSLPELVSTVAATRKGAYDLALGNIFGSNTLNMVILIPLDFAYTGSLLASVSETHLLTCMATILITAVSIVGQLYQVEKRKILIEPDAFLIIVLVVLTNVSIYFLEKAN